MRFATVYKPRSRRGKNAPWLIALSIAAGRRRIVTGFTSRGDTEQLADRLSRIVQRVRANQGSEREIDAEITAARPPRERRSAADGARGASADCGAGMTRFPLMELSPPLFPDLLDEWRRTDIETHVFSGPSTYRRTRRDDGSDHRAISVLWNDPKWDFPDQPRKRWTVELTHYINTWSGEGRKRQHHFRMRSVCRDFDSRRETVEFADRLRRRLEAVERVKGECREAVSA